MIPDILCNTYKGTHPKWSAAFARGCGGRIHSGPYLVKPGHPIALFGSVFYWTCISRAKRLGVDWYYGDHGYFRRRVFFRCTKNGFQLTSDTIKTVSTAPERFNALGVKLAPWRTSGKHILFCPPDDKFATLHGFRADAWASETYAAIQANTDRPIKIRRRDSKTILAADLHDCWALVTHSSNVAVEAIVNGVPVVCLQPCAASMVSAASLSEIESPPTPPRLDWASALANSQWTLDEMRRGTLWKAIGE